MLRLATACEMHVRLDIVGEKQLAQQRKNDFSFAASDLRKVETLLRTNDALQKRLLFHCRDDLIVSAVGIALKIKDGREIIPYGPFLSMAAIVSMFWGERILEALFYGMR